MGDGKCSNPNKYFKGCTYFILRVCASWPCALGSKIAVNLTRPGQVRLLVVSDWIGIVISPKIHWVVCLYTGDIIVWYLPILVPNQLS